MAESTGWKPTRDDVFWTTKPSNCLTTGNNFGGRSVWFDMNDICSLLRIIRVGDKLELVNSNPPSAHWAIYVNELNFLPQNVVHYFPDNGEERSDSYMETYLPVSLPSSTNALVVNSVHKFTSLPGGKLRINNSKDEDWQPVCTKNICKEISYQLKELQNRFVCEKVNVYGCRNSFKDSEDFVNYCRYDRDHQHYMCPPNGEKVTKWYSTGSIEDFIREVHAGDRLEFGRQYPYKHWGMYIGQWRDDSKQVVHIAPGDENKVTNAATASSNGPSARPKPRLCVESIGTVLGKGEVRINNEEDKVCPALDTTDILDEIKSQLAHNACESQCKVSFKDSKGFVNYCRYDNWRINYGLVSDWCESWQSLPRLRVGDRLEFKTALLYRYWGIYVGEMGFYSARVIHFAPANRNRKIFRKKIAASWASSTNTPVICLDHIDEVLVNNEVRINNDGDRFCPPIVREDILDEIKRQLKSQSDGHKPGFRVFSNNCEHFVNRIRYGVHHIDQVSRFSGLSITNG